MNIKRGVEIIYEDKETIKYLCPLCNEEQEQEKSVFFDSINISPVLCKKCCNIYKARRDGGLALPIPGTDTGYGEPTLRWYSAVPETKLF